MAEVASREEEETRRISEGLQTVLKATDVSDRRGVRILFESMISYKPCDILILKVNNMPDVLSEAAFRLDIMLLIPVFMMIFILFFPKMWKNSWKGKYTMVSYKFVKISVVEINVYSCYYVIENLI